MAATHRTGCTASASFRQIKFKLNVAAKTQTQPPPTPASGLGEPRAWRHSAIHAGDLNLANQPPGNHFSEIKKESKRDRTQRDDFQKTKTDPFFSFSSFSSH